MSDELFVVLVVAPSNRTELECRYKETGTRVNIRNKKNKLKF